MATLAKIPVEITGLGAGGTGVSVFYTSNLAPLTFMTAIHAMYDGLKAIFPDDVAFVFPGDGDLISDATGGIAGAWSVTAPSPVVGTASGVYAAGVGARLVWATAGVTRGRRVRGTTFLVPIAGAQYKNDGGLADGNTTAWAAVADDLFAADSGSMRIWSRPSTGGGSDGTSHAVTGVTVPNKVSWLRSRRT
jgi:hypothetical protein